MVKNEMVHRLGRENVRSGRKEIVRRCGNEVVHSGANERISFVGPLESNAGFYVYRMPRADKGVPRKEKPATGGKRGRPPVYNGTDRRIVAAALKHHGYTKGLEFLRKERNLTVSMTLARSVAEEFGIEFTRGRPAA